MLDQSTEIIAKGYFIEECTNRFLCKVRLTELKQTLCYVPSSARLTNIIALKGKTVCMSSLNNGNCSKYSLLARQDGQRYTLLNLNLVNALMHVTLKNEKRYSMVDMQVNKLTSFGYRSDLLASFKRTEYFEVKSLLSDKVATSFPTVFGERALKQLEQISDGLASGERFTYILALLNPKIKTINLDNANSEYNALIKKCFAQGLKIRIYRLNWIVGSKPHLFEQGRRSKSLYCNYRRYLHE